MYSQYQSYPQGGAAAPQSSGMTWNGSQWVSSTANMVWNGSSWEPASAIPPNAVQLYTNYYHQYTAKAGEQQRIVQSLPLGSAARNAAQTQLQWYQHYADQSSRAAHHFHQNPQTPAPFDLPPDPALSQQQEQQPAAIAAQPAAVPAPAPVYHPPAPTPAPAPASQSPDGLKRYVDRCLSAAKTTADKARVMREVEKVIALAVQENSMHSTNWDAVPLVSVPSTANVTAPAAGSATNAASGTSNYYGPAATAAAPSQSAVSATTGYYGPASAAPPQPTKTSFTVKRQRTSKKAKQQTLPANESYYGPASSTPAANSHPSSQQQQNAINGSSPDEDFLPLFKNRTFKRKSSLGFDQSSSTLGNRAKRFQGPGGIADSSSATKDVSGYGRYMGMGTIGGKAELDEEDYENMKVKGTSQVLEKDYLRLTAPPRAELVRPQPILEQHLRNLKAERQRSDRHDYLWFCSQLKAVRQDCTVQHIQNACAVDVYETHARIALEEGDLNEYNQCQTQLKELYGKLKDEPKALVNRLEFVAYRLLYYVFLTGNEKYDGGSSEIFKIMLTLTAEERHDPAIAHALQVRVAVTYSDYHAFFRLRRKSPNLGSHLMDRIVPGLRFNALLRIGKAYRPSVNVRFVLAELGLEHEVEYGRKWLESCGCVIKGDTWITKDSELHESDLDDKQSLI